MQERAVTLDGRTLPLSPGFMVVATQNPIEHEGTYPLPEAQLDRFLMKLIVPWPSRDEERRIVRQHGGAVVAQQDDGAVADLAAIEAARAVVDNLAMADEIVDYTVDLVRATRTHPALLHGASPRAAVMLARAARSLAALRGRDFVLPDDVKELFLPTLRHRVVLAPEAELDGRDVGRVLQDVRQQVAAPR
jgi:MoxR-like ATPase